MSGWVYLHFPDMYLHSIVTEDNGCPLVILSGDGQRIIQVSDSAQRHGVQVDMPLASALYLCPDISCHSLDTEYASQLLQQRALWAYRYSAQVYPDAPQGLWLEAGSMLRLFGGLNAFLDELEASCLSHQWPVQSAIANTPLAARWLALADAGIRSLEHNELQQALTALPLIKLQLPERQLMALQRLGINTLGELRRLPLAETGRRISPELMMQLRQLDGDQSPPTEPFYPPLRFSDTALFNHEAEHRNGLYFPLSRLLGSLCGFLHHHQLSVRWLHLYLRHRELPASHWLFSFAREEYRYQELLQLCRYQLDKQTLPAPVTEIRLHVEQFSSRVHEQSCCLEPDEFTSRAETLLNRLQARLSSEQVSVLSTTGDPRPDMAWQAVPAGQLAPVKPPRHGQWPVWLLPQPQPCQPPDKVVHGPVRISSGWWENQSVRRDYYQVLNHDQLIWVFRDDQQRWFVHGYFS